MFQSSGRQREIDHNSYGIRVRFQVVDIRGRVASEQLRKIVTACPQPQHLPLLTPPGAVKDKVLSRLRYLIAISKAHFGCPNVVCIPLQWRHAYVEPCEDARSRLGPVTVNDDENGGFRKGCPIFTDLGSYVQCSLETSNIMLDRIGIHRDAVRSCMRA